MKVSPTVTASETPAQAGNRVRELPASFEKPRNRRSTSRTAAASVLAVPSELCPRILIYSHDTFGLGHFRRCLKIARALNTLFPGASVLLLTGSPLAHRYPMPDGVDFVKLPAVLKEGNEHYRSRSVRLSIEELTQLRSEIIRVTAANFRPDVFLVDHAPLGLRGEAVLALRELRTQRQHPFVILGLRDIIDEPSRVIPAWQSTGVYEAMENLYDRVVVYGSPKIFDPIESYRFPESIRGKTAYVGFISGEESCSRGTVRKVAAKESPQVLITVGGGEDGSRIVESYLAMLSAFGDRAGFGSIILPGPLLSARAVQQLRSAARHLPVRIRHFIPEVAPLLRRADLTISMGGYNAIAEIMSCAQRALIVPRDTPRMEQLLRARRLQELGLVSVLRMGELGPARLFQEITQLLDDAHRPLEAAREDNLFALDGATQLGQLLLDALSERARHRAEP